MYPASQRGLCHLGGEGGETSPSPQLPRNCSLPTPGPGHHLGQSLQGRSALHRATRLCCWRPDGWECGTPLTPIPSLGQLSPLPGSYTRACTKAPFTPPAPPSAPPSRPAALPLPTRSITGWVGTLPVVARQDQGRGRCARCSHSRRHKGSRHSPVDFLLRFYSCPPAPSKACPRNYSSRVFLLCVAMKGVARTVPWTCASVSVSVHVHLRCQCDLASRREKG